MTEQQQVYPTWQTVFINLITECSSKWLAGEYVSAYDSLLILREWLPQVCYDETKDVYDALIKKLEETRNLMVDRIQYLEPSFAYYTLGGVRRRLRTLTDSILFKEVLAVSGHVRRSLEKHGYLSKDAGAKPKYEHREVAKI